MENELMQAIEAQIPLMYIGTGLFLGGIVVLTLILFELMFYHKKSLSRTSKRILMALCAVWLLIMSGIGVYLWAMARVGK